MAKKVDDSVLDAALNEIGNNCDLMTVCAGEPAGYAEANSGGANFLADAAMSVADFSLTDGDVSGRKISVASKSGILVDQGGIADHVALLDTANSRLLYVTTCTSLELVAGSELTFNGWDIEIADPAV
ncbi:hypothetical protein [Emcibacter sp.]|uniref:hypothetical protein n=1 Tax=Emcibacter sp. TaxID=1979954 RepID=UPI002AA688FE|nr:hypothetical protein [Emcibacter sp.]